MGPNGSGIFKSNYRKRPVQIYCFSYTNIKMKKEEDDDDVEKKKWAPLRLMNRIDDNHHKIIQPDKRN